MYFIQIRAPEAVTVVFSANPQNIIRNSAKADHISVQYHCKRRGLLLSSLAPGVDLYANDALFEGSYTSYTSSKAFKTLPFHPGSRIQERVLP